MQYIWPGLVGGIVAAGVLVLQHYKVDRARLKRQHAYILGVMGLNAGFLVFVLVAGLDIWLLTGPALVEAVAGSAVLLVYRLDKQGPPPDTGQLQEALNQADALRQELATAHQEISVLKEVLVTGPVKWGELVDIYSPILTALEDLTRIKASLEAADRVYHRLQRRASSQPVPEKVQKMNAARAAARKEGKDL